MSIKLTKIGHCALRVKDVERSKQFYTEVLGLQVMEQNEGHGGAIFMSLPIDEDGHTIDLFPVDNPNTAESVKRNRAGLAHIAFKVSSYEASKDAYDALQHHDVKIDHMIDHSSQRSIYFTDPDGNQLEIYYEYPNARELFMQGRSDDDRPFSFD